MSAAKPLIGVAACARPGERSVFHGVATQYLAAVVDGIGGVPLIVPALGDRTSFADIIGRIDGLLLPGSRSNVGPHHYGATSRPGTLHDPDRDATTLPLIRMALSEGVPLFAICRGHQELNVALGGTLHQHVHELPNRHDHRAPQVDAAAERYGYAHAVALAPGGMLARLAGADHAVVNSLHAQAIDRLADGLAVEATAPDGVVEAVRVTAARNFAVGVQWHPEWHIASDTLSRALFSAFGDAARARAARRTATSGAA